MHSNIMLRHKVVKLIRRHLEDAHGFVEVHSDTRCLVVFEFSERKIEMV